VVKLQQEFHHVDSQFVVLGFGVVVVVNSLSREREGMREGNERILVFPHQVVQYIGTKSALNYNRVLSNNTLTNLLIFLQLSSKIDLN
jgi:hypothetical protein